MKPAPLLSKPSLGNRLLRHVLLPLALTWLLGSVLVLGIAFYFAQKAFDRSLLDDAYLVARHVRASASDGHKQLTLSLSSEEISAILFDQSETLYFAVLHADGSLLGGHAGLRPSELLPQAGPSFGSLSYQNRQLRTVTIYRQQPANFYVVMAQTTTSRDLLLQRLIVFSVGLQLVLLLLLAAWLQRAIRQDLQPLALLEKAVDQRDAQDLTPVPVSASTRDVQRLGEAINALLQRITRSAQAQKEFSGNVAHELRTPLAGIRALAEYGLRQSDPLIWREQLEGIVQSQARASRLVDQLLALALADEAHETLRLAPVALDDLVREAVLFFLPRSDAAGVDLGARGVEQDVQVLGNAALIEGVLHNLIDNALRYGGATEGPSIVTVEVAMSAHEVLLSVTDNGPGVTAQQLQLLQRRWVQGHAGEALKAGSGLGLAIVNEYVRILDARLAMQTINPTGLRVTVALKKPL